MSTKHMTEATCTKIVKAIHASQASTYGNAATLAQALVSGELEVAVLDKSLNDAFTEASDRNRVEAAIRTALRRITGQPKKDAEGNIIKDDAGNVVLEGPVMAIGRKNAKREDKTLWFKPSAESKGSGKKSTEQRSAGGVASQPQGPAPIPFNTAGLVEAVTKQLQSLQGKEKLDFADALVAALNNAGVFLANKEAIRPERQGAGEPEMRQAA